MSVGHEPVAPSTRRGPREDRDAARRRQLLDTGLHTFGTIGYARSAIETMCAEAKVGTRSFYELFTSKEDLLAAVYGEVIERLGGRLEAALAREPQDLERHVHGAVRAAVGHVTGDEHAARVQLLEVVGVSPRLEHARRAVMHGFADVFVRESERLHGLGLAPRPLSPGLAMALSGGTNELLIDWLVAERRPPRRELTDELTRFYVAVIG